MYPFLWFIRSIHYTQDVIAIERELLRLGFHEEQDAIDPGRSRSYIFADEGRISCTVSFRRCEAYFWLSWVDGGVHHMAYQGKCAQVAELLPLLKKSLASLADVRHVTTCKT